MDLGSDIKKVICAAVGTLFLHSAAMAQVLTDTADGVLSASIPFGNLTPGTSTTSSSTQIQFRLRSNSDTGYKVLASAIFNVTPTALVQGGATVTASDIGVGITSLVSGPSVKTPRTDAIATGFDYNPATIAAANGLSPYTGAASGRATLADIVATPNLMILSGPKIANNQGTNSSTNFITVTVTFGLLGQFFTPATLSGVLTLTIVNGP